MPSLFVSRKCNSRTLATFRSVAVRQFGQLYSLVAVDLWSRIDRVLVDRDNIGFTVCCFVREVV